MRRLLLTLALTLGLITFNPAPAQAVAYNPPVHRNCPGGLTVALDGGSGYKWLMRETVAWYNNLAAQGGREGWPKIVEVREKFKWDGNVYVYNPCTIDVDERWEVTVNGADVAGAAPFGYYTSDNHMTGCGILLAGKHWSGGTWEDRYVVVHEFMHCIGLAHNFNEVNSVMSYHYQCICLVYSDLTTLSHQLYTRGGHH